MQYCVLDDGVEINILTGHATLTLVIFYPMPGAWHRHQWEQTSGTKK